MATVKQNMSANISFGGTLDPSWTKSVSGLERGISQLTKDSVKLTAAQKKLTAQIEAGTRAGKDVSELEKRYHHLGDEIKRNTREQERFNRSLGRSKALSRFRGAAAGAGKKTLGFAKTAALWGGAGLTGGLAVGALSPILLADMAAAKKAQSDKYKIPIKEYVAMEGFGNAIGLTADDFGEMFNTYKGKAGAHKTRGKEKSIDTYFPALGFKPGEMKGLGADAQFEKILNRAFASPDRLKADKAVAALLGGNGTKALNALRANGMNYTDSMKPYRSLSTLDDEGATGGAEINDAMFRLKSAFLSGGMQIAGQLGHIFAPAVNASAQGLADWFKNKDNLDKVKLLFTDTIVPGLKAFGGGVMLIAQVLYSAAKKLSFLVPDEKSEKKEILSYVAGGNMDAARELAQKKDLGPWLDKITANAETVKALKASRSDAMDDVFNKERILHPRDYWDNVDEKALSIVGDDGASPGGFDSLMSDLKTTLKQGQSSADASAPSTVNNVFNVTQNEGESGGDFANRVAEMAQQNAQLSNRNNMGDVPGV